MNDCCTSGAGLYVVLPASFALITHVPTPVNDTVPPESEQTLVAELSIALGEAGVGIAALVPGTATLEELFFRMTEGGDPGPAPVPANGRARVEEAVR